MAERVQSKRDKVAGGGNYFASPKPNIAFIPTGCKVLDLALGGGWAEGRIANIVGDKSTGKTLLCIEASANFAMKHKKGRILYREAEAAFDEDYAAALGMPVERIEFSDVPIHTVEDFYKDLEAVVKKAETSGVPALYILDSLDALSDAAEVERDIGDGSYNMSKPKQMSATFRKLVRRIEASGTTLIIVSQVRDKIGALIGRKTTRSGGRALDFYASQVIYLQHLGMLTRTVKGVKRKTGVKIKANVDKNKVGLPFREAQFEITFGYGIEDEDACLDWLKEIKERVPDNISTDQLHRLVERRWYEIEHSFMPTRSKYGG